MATLWFPKGQVSRGLRGSGVLGDRLHMGSQACPRRGAPALVPFRPAPGPRQTLATVTVGPAPFVGPPPYRSWLLSVGCRPGHRKSTNPWSLSTTGVARFTLRYCSRLACTIVACLFSLSALTIAPQPVISAPAAPARRRDPTSDPRTSRTRHAVEFTARSSPNNMMLCSRF